MPDRRLPVLDALVVFVDFAGKQNDHGQRTQAADDDVYHYDSISNKKFPQSGPKNRIAV
jgi:hypothetical protein